MGQSICPGQDVEINSGPQLECLQDNREDEADADVINSLPQQGRIGHIGAHAAESHKNFGDDQYQQGPKVTERQKLLQKGNPYLANEEAAGKGKNQNHPATPWGLPQVEKPATNTRRRALKTGVLWAQGLWDEWG